MYALRSRRLLRLSGKDAETFLQGVVTNDMKTIAGKGIEEVGVSRSMYTAFLNPKGRYLFEGFIIKDGREDSEEDTCLLDIHQQHAEYAQKYLNRYKLRSDVLIEDVSDQMQVSWGFSMNPASILKSNDGLEKIMLTDPRWEWLGLRSIESINHDKESGDELYNRHRLCLGVPETEDFIFEKSLPLESNFHSLNGVCFHKGCYVGQELTARTHFTGTIRKRLTPFRASSTLLKSCSPFLLPLPYLQAPLSQVSLEVGASIVDSDGKSVGTITSYDNNTNLGIAMLRSEGLSSPSLMDGTGNVYIHPWVPMFWSPSQE